MSSSMSWELPPIEPKILGHVPVDLKHKLAERLFGHDGTVFDGGVIALGDATYHWLCGYSAALPGGDDLATVRKLIQDIGTHEAVTVRITR